MHCLFFFYNSHSFESKGTKSNKDDIRDRILSPTNTNSAKLRKPGKVTLIPLQLLKH